MTRRTRTAALLSATTLLAGATFSLALAPSAAADIPTPPLGTLTADPASPLAGDLVRISGDGCFTLGGGNDKPSTDPSVAAAPAAAPTTATAPTTAAVDDPPPAGSISIVITGPDSFRSADTATASDDGTWNAEQGITVGDAGDYSVDATCTLTDPILDQQVSFDYATLALEVTAPEQTGTPLVTCNGCASATPGSSVTLGGTDFPADTTATVSLAGYDAKTTAVDADGGFNPVSIVIAADQAGGTLAGSVAAPGIDPVAFTVNVTVPEQPGAGNADGDVPGDTDTSGTDGTDGSDPADVPVTTGGTDYTSSAPTLPNTGSDTVWPGVIGGLLVLSGAGLLWAGRRREDTGVTPA